MSGVHDLIPCKPGNDRPCTWKRSLRQKVAAAGITVFHCRRVVARDFLVRYRPAGICDIITTLEIDGIEGNAAAAPHRSGSSEPPPPELRRVRMGRGCGTFVEIPDAVRQSASLHQEYLESAA